MWLLNTTSLSLRAFVEHIPDYVILSHTWGQEEVTFEDVDKPHAPRMAGYEKLRGCCELAVRDGFAWAWIDTCCIDKRSSAELSEAINSMYKWYWQAAICYAYIADVSAEAWQVNWRWDFEASRWFQRGWTLQELLAPDVVEFYNKNWSLLGTKSKLVKHIKNITKIDPKYILGREAIKDASVATKFSWAALRQTTRSEDRAYCLLGLVGVNMPMLYGEGDRAFYRLQLEVIRQTNDQSILAWQPATDDWHTKAVLASSPADFENSSCIKPTRARRSAGGNTYEMTNNGLRIALPCISIDQDRVLAILECEQEQETPLGLWLEKVGSGAYQRLPGSRLAPLRKEEREDAEVLQMYLVAEDDSNTAPVKNASAITVKAVWTDDQCIVDGIAIVKRNPIRVFERMYYPGQTGKEEEQSTYLLKHLCLTEGEASCFRLAYGYPMQWQLFDVVIGLRNDRPVTRIVPTVDAFQKNWAEEMDSNSSGEWDAVGDYVQQFNNTTMIQIDVKKKHVEQRLLWSLTIHILKCMCWAHRTGTDCTCNVNEFCNRHILCCCPECVMSRKELQLLHNNGCDCCACVTYFRGDCMCRSDMFHEKGPQEDRQTLIQQSTGRHYLECPCKLCEVESRLLFLEHHSVLELNGPATPRRRFDWIRQMQERRAKRQRPVSLPSLIV